MKSEHNHWGHRQRLKDKVRKFGLSSLQEHEILELVLTYSIPFKDTNSLAHKLIDTFGSINGVLNTEYEILKSVSGIGEETALFLSILSSFVGMCNNYKIKKKKIMLNSIVDAIAYFRTNFEIKQTETLYVLSLSSTGELLSTTNIDGLKDNEVSISLKKIGRLINTDNVHGIILIHTHPNGMALPSNNDIDFTKTVYDLCLASGVVLYDHLIFNETSHYSFISNNIIEKMEPKLNEKFKSLSLSIKNNNKSNFKYE